jgi:peptide/nickel transport system substrate-binding protein
MSFFRKALLAICCLAILQPAVPSAAADGVKAVPLPEDGPKIRELYMTVIRDQDAQILALEKGTVDILSDLARPTDIERLTANPSVELSLAQGFHGFFLGFNVRTFPWNDVALRQAACEVIPRDALIRDLFGGYAEPLATFLPPASPYFEPDVTLYAYSPDAARKRLKDAGWTWNAAGTLVSPEGKSLAPMKLLTPTAQVAPTTAELAVTVADALASIGIPIQADPMDFSTMISRMNERRFDAYVMAWQMSRDPDSLFVFYHSSMDVAGGYNIPGIADPALDAILERLRYAPDEAEARKAASDAQKALSRLVPVVPLYSRYSVSAIRKGWKGTLTTEKSTVDNTWSLLGMEREPADPRPLFMVLGEEPRTLNPVAASIATDWQVLGLLYDSLIAIDPATLEDIPWVALSWDVATEKPAAPSGRPGTRLTFHLRNDAAWHDGAPLTAKDIAFTIDYLKKNQVPRYLDSVSGVTAVETPDDRTLVVHLDRTSYWSLHNIGGLPILPAHILGNVKDWRSWQPANEKNTLRPEMSNLVGSGPFVFAGYKPGEYVRFLRNDAFRTRLRP